MKEQGSLSRLSSKCRNCRYVKTCNHKQMEALAYLLPTINNLENSIVQQIARKRKVKYR